MRRTSAILGSVVFLVIAPGFVAGVVPWWITGWVFRSPFLGFALFRFVGVGLIVVGTPIILDSFARFAIQGLGTPAPLLPTKHLVVTGLYRYVRNPMYVGVTTVIVGQALLFGDVRLLIYGGAIWLAFFIFVLVYEEPILRHTFGEEYDVFCQNVPRWIPRTHPWNK
jgi:protein-S-isoprenylcysteine O-methyltransferase Ste14